MISWQYSMPHFCCIRERECAPGAGRKACTGLRPCTRTDRVPSGASLSFAFGFKLAPLWREVAVQGTPAFFSRFLSRCCTHGVTLTLHTFDLQAFSGLPAFIFDVQDFSLASVPSVVSPTACFVDHFLTNLGVK